MDSTVTIKATLSEARTLRALVEDRISAINGAIGKGEVHGQERLTMERERIDLNKLLPSL
jgi:hypothetical protein